MIGSKTDDVVVSDGSLSADPTRGLLFAGEVMAALVQAEFVAATVSSSSSPFQLMAVSFHVGISNEITAAYLPQDL